MWVVLFLLGLGALGVHIAMFIKALDQAKWEVDWLIVSSQFVASPLFMTSIIAFAGVSIALGCKKIARRIKERA